MKNKNFKSKDVALIAITAIGFLIFCYTQFLRPFPKDTQETTDMPTEVINNSEETQTEEKAIQTETAQPSYSSEVVSDNATDSSDSITITEITQNPDNNIDWSQAISEEEFNNLPDDQKYIDPKIGMEDIWKPGNTPTKQEALDIIYTPVINKFKHIGVFAAVPEIYDEPHSTTDEGFFVYVYNSAGSTILSVKVSKDKSVSVSLYGSRYNKGYIGTIYNTRPGSTLITEDQVKAVEAELVAQHNDICYEIYQCDGQTALLLDQDGNSYNLDLVTHSPLTPTEGRSINEAQNNITSTNMYFNTAHFAVTDAEAIPYLKNGLKLDKIPYLGATAVINMIAMEKNYSTCKFIKDVTEADQEKAYIVVFDNLYYYLIIEDTQFNEAYAIEDSDGRLAAGYPDID